jgi:hypothetical protein
MALVGSSGLGPGGGAPAPIDTESGRSNEARMINELTPSVFLFIAIPPDESCGLDTEFSWERESSSEKMRTLAHRLLELALISELDQMRKWIDNEYCGLKQRR